MNRHSLDALVFPTVRTIPAVIGDPQRGSSCSLSANTGLPALSLPVGFTGGGLPIGMEMIGRTLEDARLVGIGYSFEQATDHRREPWSTPPLVDGVAPSVIVYDLRRGSPEGVDAVSPGVSVRADFALEPTTNKLEYELEVLGAAPEDVLGVALRYPTGEDRWQVAHLLASPGLNESSGIIKLSAAQRLSLEEGDMHVLVLTRAYPFGAVAALLMRSD